MKGCFNAEKLLRLAGKVSLVSEFVSYSAARKTDRARVPGLAKHGKNWGVIKGSRRLKATTQLMYKHECVPGELATTTVLAASSPPVR